MIHGAKYADNKVKIHYDQTNNALEEFVRKIKIMEKLSGGYLNSCGLETMACCLEATQDNPFGFLNKRIQPGDYIFGYMNNKSNYDYFDKMGIKGHRSIPGNMISELYVLACKDLLDVEVAITNNLEWDDVKLLLKEKSAIQFAYFNPNHYSAIVKHDEEKNIMLVVNSWPNMPGNKNGGWHEEMSEKEFTENVKSKFILYGAQ